MCIDDSMGVIVHVTKKFCETEEENRLGDPSKRGEKMKGCTEVVPLECQSRTHPIPPNPDPNLDNQVREKDRQRQHFDV